MTAREPITVEATGETVGEAKWSALRELEARIPSLDRESVEVSTRPVRIGDIVERAVAEFGAAGERIATPTAKDLDQKVWADLDLGTRALVVLLENALSLSPPEEPVEVELERRDGELHVAVLDRGPGIPDELRERIFAAFTQADASTTRTHEGLGIGLYLARRIMSAHGGGIDLAAREGGGTIFRLAFPGIADVSVVRHQYHQATRTIENSPGVHLCAVSASLRRATTQPKP